MNCFEIASFKSVIDCFFFDFIAVFESSNTAEKYISKENPHNVADLGFVIH